MKVVIDFIVRESTTLSSHSNLMKNYNTYKSRPVNLKSILFLEWHVKIQENVQCIYIGLYFIFGPFYVFFFIKTITKVFEL